MFEIKKNYKKKKSFIFLFCSKIIAIFIVFVSLFHIVIPFLIKTYLVCLSLAIIMLNSATFITEVQFKSICFLMHTFNHSTADNSKSKIDQLTK